MTFDKELTKGQEFKAMQLIAGLGHQRADLDGLRIVARYQKYHGYAKPCVLFDEMAGQVSKLVMH